VAKNSAHSFELPFQLVEAVKSRKAIPFLGAGASKEATNAAKGRPPDANQLRDILAARFFNRDMSHRDVMAVAEMAVAISGGQARVFEAVREAFDKFEPGEAHRLLTQFNWHMIATTNYDLLVERAYEEPQRRQNLVRFVKDDEPIEERLQAVSNPIQYLKLHGCLDHLLDADVPLVLSREQYATYSQHRTRMFNRLKDHSRENTLIFIGYRLDDAHIRELIYSLQSSRRPRWFIVTPDAEDYDVDFWATKNVGVLKFRFLDLMKALDSSIPPLFRAFTPSDAVSEFPVRKFYVVRSEETQQVRDALAGDLAFVHAGMPVAEQKPKLFYEGYDTGWGAITDRLDVRRKVEEDLLFKVLLENESPKGPLLLMLRGSAGAGKTIALKRTAFEAATASNALVLWLEESGALKPEVFVELHSLSQRPIYVFVDQVALQMNKIYTLLKAAKARSLPIVVVGAERDSDWNTYCTALEDEFTPHFLRVGNLSREEVEGLLDLLERHDCLGLLKDRSREEQVEAFMEKERADRQLLVALHELTQGKPFEEIIMNEHSRIHPERARQLYLDIATMHQFGVKVRAGTISRISGIELEDYKTEFFGPLQDVVKVEQDRYTGDYAYKTRHARVATIMFRQVCPDDATRSKQFRRLIDGLDLGYSSDRRALEEITRGRTLAEAFAGVTEVREIYEAAVSIAPDQPFLYQQWAIFESNHEEGSLLEAERLAEIARQADSKAKRPNRSIAHTQAEVDRKRANAEASPLMRESLRRRARSRLEGLPSNDRFVLSTRCKILVDELAELNAELNDQSKSHELLHFAEKVRDVESAISRAHQLHPDDPDLFQTESRFRREIDQEDKALRALEHAWKAGPKGSGAALRLSQMYGARNRPGDALKVLREALGRNEDDKAVHQSPAIHYLRQPMYERSVVEEHLRRSFAPEDHNFEARFNLAQFLFFVGDLSGAISLFQEINRRAPEGFRQIAPSKENVFTERASRYVGRVERRRERFLFVKSPHYPHDIFGHRSASEADIFDELDIGQEVNFRIRFNREGPTAVDIKAGRLPI
jgi:cold shock CspA family protein